MSQRQQDPTELIPAVFLLRFVAVQSENHLLAIKMDVCFIIFACYHLTHRRHHAAAFI